MKFLIFLLFLAFLAVGCGSRPVARPFAAKRLAPASGEAPKEKTLKEKPSKASAGRVTFAGLSSRQLSDLRVIPEEGKDLFQPQNQTYDQVDGFWWRGEKEAWFKIPDRSEAWVGGPPPTSARDASRGELTVHHRTGSLLGMVGSLGVVQTRPAWVPDGGETRSPVPRPVGF